MKNISYIGLFLCIGAALGVVFDNIAIGAGVGVAIGAALDGLKSEN
ncbi:MAG: hypothetical protein ACRCSG_09235 [Cellulosilyticaceae bacterium]